MICKFLCNERCGLPAERSEKLSCDAEQEVHVQVGAPTKIRLNVLAITPVKTSKAFISVH